MAKSSPQPVYTVLLCMQSSTVHTGCGEDLAMCVAVAFLGEDTVPAALQMFQGLEAKYKPEPLPNPAVRLQQRADDSWVHHCFNCGMYNNNWMARGRGCSHVFPKLVFYVLTYSTSANMCVSTSKKRPGPQSVVWLVHVSDALVHLDLAMALLTPYMQSSLGRPPCCFASAMTACILRHVGPTDKLSCPYSLCLRDHHWKAIGCLAAWARCPSPLPRPFHFLLW